MARRGNRVTDEGIRYWRAIHPQLRPSLRESRCTAVGVGKRLEKTVMQSRSFPNVRKIAK